MPLKKKKRGGAAAPSPAAPHSPSSAFLSQAYDDDSSTAAWWWRRAPSDRHGWKYFLRGTHQWVKMPLSNRRLLRAGSLLVVVACAAAAATRHPVPPCVDADERCAGWEARGECEDNPGFMLTQVRSVPACERASDATFSTHVRDKRVSSLASSSTLWFDWGIKRTRTREHARALPARPRRNPFPLSRVSLLSLSSARTPSRHARSHVSS